jgi:hypothetical protein
MPDGRGRPWPWHAGSAPDPGAVALPQAMKINTSLLLLAMMLSVTGCQSYVYRVVQPATGSQVIANQPVSVHYDPLDYQFARNSDRLSMRILNPTDNQVQLVANRSYVVDPKGETHPMRGRLIAPHSYISMLLPPIPLTLPYAYPGWAWGPYWTGPYYGYYDPWYGYYQVFTQYDWTWKTGLARLHLNFEHAGQTFTHDFQIAREPEQ